jgi:YgiT-type zinc finger domain-containing protein
MSDRPGDVADPRTCVACNTSDLASWLVTFTSSDAQATVIITGVPADVCGNCGEVYYDEATTRRLLEVAAEARASGAKLVLREYGT